MGFLSAEQNEEVEELIDEYIQAELDEDIEEMEKIDYIISTKYHISMGW